MNDQTQPEMTPEAVSHPELTVTDLTNIRSIIDIAVRRGTFGAAEISGVGTTFDKLNAFINAVTAKPDDGATQ
jgi:uncharacterized protein YggE